MTEQNGLERSSATERLRAMLDERGVEWVASGTDTCWTGADGYPMRAWETTNGTHMRVADLTPEQAIEATLGKRECDAEVEVVEFSQMQEIHRFTCSECGESFGAEEHGGLFGLVLNKVKLPNYCPNCGRRVRK